ncbi:MAG: LysR family transcriptional regulator [Acidobacteriota bacterium]|nr:LysR family transcriptional regulator [Acidobacteriota bacterium]
MEWLNYHHLYYFWVVGRTGSVAAASRELRLTHPTISAQIHQLEDIIGEKLFRRAGRGLALTDVGQMAFRYANDIFGLGREFMDVVKRRSTPQVMRLALGVTDFLPKSIVQRLLEPALRMDGPQRLIVREDRSLSDFLDELSMHALDLVLADAPASVGSPLKLFNHLLGDCGTTIYGSAAVAASLKRRFPRSLDGARFLVPGANAALRRGIEQWFDAQGIRPQVVAEIDDSCLLQVLAAGGHGVFAGPSVMEADVRAHYGLRPVGPIPSLRQRFYAISVEQRLRHPGAVAICQNARDEYFV